MWTLSSLCHFTPRAELDIVDTRKEFAPVGIHTSDRQAHSLLSTPQQITKADYGVDQASNQLSPGAFFLKKKRNGRETDQSPPVSR